MLFRKSKYDRKSYMNSFKIGDLEVKIPVVQGGMGVGISLSGLASAVANEGGIGVVSAVGVGLFEPDYAKNFLGAHLRATRKEIRKARELTDGILGINAMVASVPKAVIVGYIPFDVTVL